ncbi:MAG: hypothetical protein AAF533_27355 [Acidobacteriota bacterium]
MSPTEPTRSSWDLPFAWLVGMGLLLVPSLLLPVPRLVPLLTATGPLGLLLYKPGENLGGKLTLALVIIVVVGSALSFALRFVGREHAWRRRFVVGGVALAWHGLGLALALVLASGMN